MTYSPKNPKWIPRSTTSKTQPREIPYVIETEGAESGGAGRPAPVRVALDEAVATAQAVVDGTLVRARLDIEDEAVWQIILRTPSRRMFELLIDARHGRVLAAAYLPSGVSESDTIWSWSD